MFLESRPLLHGSMPAQGLGQRAQDCWSRGVTQPCEQMQM
jgi:hypothetical protein